MNLCLPPFDDALQLLYEFKYIFKSKTLYMLGAGASKKYTDNSYERYDSIRDRIIQMGAWPIPEPAPSLSEEEKSRLGILGSPFIKSFINNRMDFYDQIIHSNPQVSELLCAIAYSLDEYPVHSPEYQLLNLSNPRSVIVNLNHDGLAEHFIKKRKIITLHGTVTPKNRLLIKKFIPDSLDDIGIRKNFLSNTHIIAPESEHLLHRKEYRDLKTALQCNQFNYIVIIGYAFFGGKRRNILDTVTYGLIRDYLYTHNLCKVVIIDPEPAVADILSGTLSTLHARCFPICWDKFSYAAFNAIRLKSNSHWNFDATECRRFAGIYYNFLNGNALKIITNPTNFSLKKSSSW